MGILWKFFSGMEKSLEIFLWDGNSLDFLLWGKKIFEFFAFFLRKCGPKGRRP
jgi:hypothetical protein